MRLIKSLFAKKNASRFACPYCNHHVQESEVCFRCTNGDCRDPQIDIEGILQRLAARFHPDEQAKKREDIRERLFPGETPRTIFKPQSYSHKVTCPVADCHRGTTLKLCPNCWFLLPSVLERSQALTIVGSRSSGKTCYGMALVETLNGHVARSFRSCVLFEDDEGEEYFKKKIQRLKNTGELPDGNEKNYSETVQSPSIQMTIQFPKYHKGVEDQSSTSAVPFIFHDPAGEWFKNRDEVHQTTFLANTRSIILLLDPETFDKFKPSRPAGTSEETEEEPSPKDALENLIDGMRKDLGLKDSQKIPKELAVVISKADIGKVFGGGASPDRLPRLTRPFNSKLVDKVSQICKEALNDAEGLNAPFIVNMAERNFETVRFFAVSALGNALRTDKTIDPKNWISKRVEDPFLWIMHEWGVI